MGRMRWRWRWRMILVAAGVVMAGVVVGPAGPAAGQEPSTPSPSTSSSTTTRPAGAVPSVAEVAAAILEDGWYAHPEAVGDREQLDRVADRLTDRRHGIGFVLLADEPPGSSTRYAEDVLDEVIFQSSIWYPGRTSTTTATTTPGATTSTSVFRYVPTPDIRTVVVVSDADVGVVSDRWGDDAIDAALDETIEELRDDPTDGLEALADALADQPIGDDDPDGGDDEVPFVAIVVGLFGLLAAAQTVWATVRSTDEDPGDNDDGDSEGGSSRRRRYNPLLSRPFSSGARIGGGSRSGGGGGGSGGGSSRGRGGRRL